MNIFAKQLICISVSEKNRTLQFRIIICEVVPRPKRLFTVKTGLPHLGASTETVEPEEPNIKMMSVAFNDVSMVFLCPTLGYLPGICMKMR